VLGKSFLIQCGVRQGGVLSPYVFSLYVDDVIKALRNSGYGIFVGSIFVGCILVLLSSSFCGLQNNGKYLLSMELVGILNLTLLKVSV